MCVTVTNDLEPTRSTKHLQQQGLPTSGKSPREKSNCTVKQMELPVLPKKKKKKSPSTQKRDKQRLSKWLTSKKSLTIFSTDRQPTSQTPNPSNSTNAEPVRTKPASAVPGNQAKKLENGVNIVPEKQQNVQCSSLPIQPDMPEQHPSQNRLRISA